MISSRINARAAAGRAALLLAALCLMLVACDKEYSPKNADRARTGLNSIADALERYAADHDGCYPSKIEDLASGDYMKKYPFNAYKKPLPLLGAPQMQVLKPGAPPTNGDFVYIPGVSASTPGNCKDYKLYLYGDSRDVDLEEKIDAADGVKLDRVILLIVGERGAYVPGKRF